MDDTFAFLGLPKISIGNETRSEHAHVAHRQRETRARARARAPSPYPWAFVLSGRYSLASRLRPRACRQRTRVVLLTCARVRGAVCVHGKAGVMDVLNAFEGSVRIGRKEVAPDTLNVGACDVVPSGMQRESRYGALHHIIEPALLRRLRRYYEPANKRLYKFLGRDLGW